MGVLRRLRERQVDAEAVVAARVDERGHDAHGGVVRPHLHVRVDVDLVPADARLGGAVHVIGPVVGARDAHAGPDRAALVDPDGDGERARPRTSPVVGASSCRSRRGRRRPPAGRSPACRRARRSRSAGSTSTRTSPLVTMTEPSVSLISTGWASGRRLEGRPAVARHLAGAGEDLARRRLLHGHPDHGVGPGPEPRVDVLLRLCDGDVGLLLGADGDGDVEALLGVLDQHVVDPGLVVDPRALHHPQHRADGVGIEHHRSGQPGPLGEHLHVGGGRAVGGHDQLHDTRSGPAATG